MRILSSPMRYPIANQIRAARKKPAMELDRFMSLVYRVRRATLRRKTDYLIEYDIKPPQFDILRALWLGDCPMSRPEIMGATGLLADSVNPALIHLENKKLIQGDQKKWLTSYGRGFADRVCSAYDDAIAKDFAQLKGVSLGELNGHLEKLLEFFGNKSPSKL